MLDLLKHLCLSTTDGVFSTLGDYGFTTTHVKKRRYAFRPGKTTRSPLMVCHADTVIDGGNGPHNFDVKGSNVNSIALDDRLGIAAMLNTIDLNSAMANCAMLVCDEEEIGRSTAQIFDEPIIPNWLVELDRRGTDVVSYEYESLLLNSLLQHAGFEPGRGSFSDICYLEHLGVCGFNVGVGYHREHSKECFANLRDTTSQMAKLENFYLKFSDVRLDFEPYQPASRQYNDEFEWDDYITDLVNEDDDTDNWTGSHHLKF